MGKNDWWCNNLVFPEFYDVPVTNPVDWIQYKDSVIYVGF